MSVKKPRRKKSTKIHRIEKRFVKRKKLKLHKRMAYHGKRKIAVKLRAERPETELRRTKVTTPADKLLDLVNEKGRIDAKAAAKTLKVKEADVEKWATILEDHGLLKLYYPAIGKPELRKIDAEEQPNISYVEKEVELKKPPEKRIKKTHKAGHFLKWLLIGGKRGKK